MWPANAGLFIASGGLSMFGNAIANVVWVWLVLDRTGDPAAAGVVAMFISIPAIVFSFFGGRLIDSVGRKPMSVVSDVISASSVALLIVVDSLTDLTVGWFIVLGIIGAVGDVPGMAARQALTGDVARCSGWSVDRLAGLSQSVAGMSFLVGPALGGVLLSMLPTTSVLWITVACSAAAAVVTFVLRISPAAVQVDEEQPQSVRGVVARARSEVTAWRAIVAHPQVTMLAVLSFAGALLVMPYLIVLTPAHFHRVDNPSMYGVTMSSYAVGMMAGGVFVAKVGTARRRRMWMIALVFETVCFALMAWLAGGWVLAFAFALAGVSGGILNPLQTVMITEKVDDRVRGRAFSLFQMINLVGQPVGLAVVTMAVNYASIYTVAVWLCLAWVPVAVYSFWSARRHVEVLAPSAVA
ncbi:hypothetical protein CAQU_07595 [Corynebacterium aquilae DSM 44791]|uniref:Major facilitator superfamily (MFS) profile domain-containing protein n=1 Tax=Corynebacterium aquilae DSM 44791 TaxID=1431546 RepID=A0A1L7CGK7_9CORY|nr:hypothetical protein CAQU_07595 [Corynebacterium aquilae DSM 44791]